MSSFLNLSAAPSNGTLRFQNGAYINNSLTATLQATFGFNGVVNGRTLLLDPRYLKTAEAVYVSTADPRDQFMVSWNVDNRTSSMGSPVRFSATGAKISFLEDSDDAGVYKLTSLKLEDYWVGKGSNAKFLNYSVASSPFSLTLLKAPNYTYQMSSTGAVAEGQSVQLSITRVGETGFSSVVYLSTIAGTAIAGGDFVALNKAAVTFGANETTRVIHVKAMADTLVEGNETFNAQLFNKTSDMTAALTQQITITNTVPTFAYTVTALTEATEGGAVTFKIDRTGTTDLASSVFVSTASGTASDNVDYVSLQRSPLQFDAGQISKTLQVVTRVDAATEGDENFLFRLFDSVTAQTHVASATGTIKNKDAINLVGTAARENIFGNELDNIITGLGGGDIISGGAGRDIFRYLNLSDSGLTTLTQDRVTDFKKGEDKVDLSAIDANPLQAGDQAFTGLISITTGFSQPGQMKLNHNGGSNFTLFLNTNTNSAAEAAINIQLVGTLNGPPQSFGLSDLVL